MKARCYTDKKQVEFLLSEVTLPYHQAVLDLGYSGGEIRDEFGRTLPVTAPPDEHFCRNLASTQTLLSPKPGYMATSPDMRGG